MATNRELLGALLLGSSLLLTSVGGWTENDKPSSKGVAIPELPVEERAANSTSLEEETPPTTIINYEGPIVNPGLFTESSVSRGFPRYFSALDISGYLRTRFSYFHNPHLRTYIPGDVGRGTSDFMPNLSALDSNVDEGVTNPVQNNFSANMRLRLDPTINISELTRVRATLDIFDNMVLGSTPSYMSSRASMMSMSQNPPAQGINTWQSAIAVKRVWGEASFPIGELRFGRMPFHWGLGILYNSGDEITSDYGDQIDGILFTTRLFDHYFTPGYSIAYTGPVGRGGGHFSSAPNNPSRLLLGEEGQRYPLESSDLAHVFSLSFLKRDSDFITNKKRAEGNLIFNYGLFASYRTQDIDSRHDDINSAMNPSLLYKRRGHVGMGSWWTAFSYRTFHVEAEFAGIWGKYRVGETKTDPLAPIGADGKAIERDVWLLQGGFALESKYGFLDDRLQVGLNGGLASAQSGPGFGIREGVNPNPKPGEADGQKMPEDNKFKTNFKFNPAYSVDLLMYREVLGGVAGTYYIKPHLSYFFSRNFGLRGDAITSFAIKKSNTTGHSNFLGVEIDASAFLRTENGFYFSLAYGVLFPLKGLDHRKGTINDNNFKTYGSAQMAQTLQFFFGLMF